MIQIPDAGAKADVYPEWGADDVEALAALIGGWTFVAAEDTIDELYQELGMRCGERPHVDERIGRIAERVSAALVASLREQLEHGEREGSWEPCRVVLERMRGNPEARPARSPGNITRT